MNKCKDIGNRIKHLRGPDTQLDFAKKLGMTLRSYQRYESGERMPKGDVAQRIASFRGLPVDFLLHGEARQITLDEAREQVKYDLWLEGVKPEDDILESLAHRRMEGLNAKPAPIAAETHAVYLDDESKKILDMLKDMDREGRRDVLKYTEEKKQAAAYRREQKLKEG
jgi:transcriptional regulator with XRE-family HTH domain